MSTPRLLPALALVLVAAGACGDADDSAEAAVTEPAAAADATAGGPADPVVGVGPTELGDVLVDARGLSLYAFLTDIDGQSSCYDACAQAWPPLLVDGADVPALPAGLDPAVFSVTERTDGTHQLVAGDWPLYTYFEDGAPGDIVGQGSGGVWYLVAPDGELIQEAPAGLRSGTESPDDPADAPVQDPYGY